MELFLLLLFVYIVVMLFVLRKPKSVRDRHAAAAKFEQSIIAKGQAEARKSKAKV